MDQRGTVRRTICVGSWAQRHGPPL